MKKAMTIVLATMICVISMAGCGIGGKKVKMGTEALFPPFEYSVAKGKGIVGKFSGVDIAIGNEIAKEMGMNLGVEDMEFESVILSVSTGAVDFAAAGLSITPDRQESVDFSIPYYNATQYIIVREDGPVIGSANDILDKKVGVIDNFTGQTICRDMLEIKNLEGYKKATDAVMALSQSKIDAVVIDSHTAMALVKQNTGLAIVKDPVFENEEYAIAVQKGNTEMLNTVNRVLERLILEGKIDEWVAQYTTEAGIDEE